MAQEDVDNERPQARLRLVVGLGNPGERYASTRHNVGFMVADRLAGDAGIALGREKFGAVFGRGRLEGNEIILAKPISFMNRSGPPVRALRTFSRFRAGRCWSSTTTSTWTTGVLKSRRKEGMAGTMA